MRTQEHGTSPSHTTSAPPSPPRSRSRGPSTARTAADLLRDADGVLQTGGGYNATPVPTGFTPLDDCLGGGLRSGELSLVSGQPGLGKTLFALQAARNVAVAGGRVVYVCYEHTEQQLLERLIALEAGLLAGAEGVSLNAVRRALQAAGSSASLADRHADPVWREALKTVASYGDRLELVCGSGRQTGLAQLRELAQDHAAPCTLLIVDYLQKVPYPVSVDSEDHGVTVVVEELKDIALETGTPVLAVVAADKEGFEGRTRLNHLRGSTALVYEADVLLVLNDKVAILAKHHLMYGSVGTERYKDFVICTIEKNRGGVSGVDLEFRKHFDQARFDPCGNTVVESLIDDGVHVA